MIWNWFSLGCTLGVGASFRVTWILRADSPPLAFPAPHCPRGSISSVRTNKARQHKSDAGERRNGRRQRKDIAVAEAKMAYQKWVATRERNCYEREMNRVGGGCECGKWVQRRGQEVKSIVLSADSRAAAGAIWRHSVHAQLRRAKVMRLPH